MFNKLLIANRGEIASRVATTARRMGINTVAVYSDADAKAKHVALCDESVALGGATAAESYLIIDRIIAAAKATGAQAIHPGYGFLSENELFAEACARENIIFIGPPASAIRAMGSKSAAKTLMEKAGVPLVPGYHGENQEAAFLHQQADRIGYPVLLKASAGGGGKGMRIVERSEDFLAALASCQREAKASFGDERVLIEKYLLRPRHIEVQVFADTQGNVVSLFERDCSVQRRHQKVLEEAPAPGMSTARREAMGTAAIEAARAVGYVGAGTVEFIANQDGSFYFMEMNTRLQVEHPVTEMVTGIDLVEWQCRVANGERLPKLQHELQLNGHSIEARIYAENPEKGFLPSTGALIHLRTPHASVFTTESSIRIDSGVREGDLITPHYDPMIAKLIVWGKDRTQALARMSAALAEFEVVGPSTNIAFLGRLIQSQPFSHADLDTGLIERHHSELFPKPSLPSLTVLSLAGVMLTLDERSISSDPWAQPTGWRMNSQLERVLRFSDDSGEHAVTMQYDFDSLMVSSANSKCVVTDIDRDAAYLTCTVSGKKISAHVVRTDEVFHIFYEGHHWQLVWRDPIAHAGEHESEEGRLTAPMPGKIVSVLAVPGVVVDKGAPLLIMEAMKMEHTISAPSKGSVAELLYAVGDQVAEGAQLLTFIHQENA